MAGLLGPTTPVGQPPVEVAPHGLFTSAPEAQDPAGTRWWPGFEFQPRLCGLGGMWVPCAPNVPRDLGFNDGSGSGEQDKPASPAEGIVRFVPYVVWTQFTCTSRGFEAAEYADTAEAELLLVQEKQAEREFWTGDVMDAAVSAPDDDLPDGTTAIREIDNMALMKTTPADGVLAPGWDGGAGIPEAVSPVHALAALQQGLASSGSGARGYIHATPYLVSLWTQDLRGIDEVGGRLQTRDRGTVIVSGAGYTGEGPDVVPPLAEPAGARFQWVYATGVPEWRLGPVDIIPLRPGGREGADTFRDALDRRTNTMTFRAERFAAAVWNTCTTLAVLVDLCAEGCQTTSPSGS